MEANRKVALQNFEATLKESASEFIAKLDENNLSRTEFNEVLAEVESFIALIIEGLKNVVGPRIEENFQCVFKDLVTIIESSCRDMVARR